MESAQSGYPTMDGGSHGRFRLRRLQPNARDMTVPASVAALTAQMITLGVHIADRVTSRFVTVAISAALSSKEASSPVNGVANKEESENTQDKRSKPETIFDWGIHNAY